MLTYQEAFVLASRAERIISLRSGFAEFLMDTQVPLDVIYTDFERRGTFLQVPAHCVFKGFTLSRLPHFVPANVREFIYEPGKEEYLLNAILQ